MPSGRGDTPRTSLRTRLALAVSGVLVAQALVVSGISLVTQQRQARRELEGRASSLVLFLARVSPLGILSLNFVELDNQVRQLVVTDDEALYAAILNDEGVALATSFKTDDPLLTESVDGLVAAKRGLEAMEALRATGQVLEVTAPIRAGDQLIGTAKLGLSLEGLRGALEQQLLAIGLATLVILGFALALLNLALRRALLPVQALTAAASAVSQGHLDVPVTGTERTDELGVLARAFASMTEQLRGLITGLEQRVLERTALLEAVNRELESFAYAVSHDLRAPLRHIDGFLELLKERTAGTLDDRSRHLMATAASAARKLGTLMDDLLGFSRMSRGELVRTIVDVGELVREVRATLGQETKGRTIDWRVGALPSISADRKMLRLALGSLIANAVKFTRLEPQARIEIGSLEPPEGEEIVLFVRDNGVGFDMRYADKLFRVFQRLHRAEDWEGTGIGLANVRRVAERHGGRVWAEGTPGAGASFYLALPKARPTP